MRTGVERLAVSEPDGPLHPSGVGVGVVGMCRRYNFVAEPEAVAVEFGLAAVPTGLVALAGKGAKK
jgi:hypothetical protein